MSKVSLPTEPQNDPSHPMTKKRCTHSRLVEAVLGPQGTPTGQLLCLECHDTFPDPRYQQPLR